MIKSTKEVAGDAVLPARAMHLLLRKRGGRYLIASPANGRSSVVIKLLQLRWPPS
jgi:hypothetical protein